MAVTPSAHRGPHPALLTPGSPSTVLCGLALSSGSGEQGLGVTKPREQEGLRPTGGSEVPPRGRGLAPADQFWPSPPLPHGAWSRPGRPQFLLLCRPGGSPPLPSPHLIASPSYPACRPLSRLPHSEIKPPTLHCRSPEPPSIVAWACGSPRVTRHCGLVEPG